MRRMTTNKQINFIDKASKAIKINNLEEVIKIPFAYPDVQSLMNLLNTKVEDEEIDFDNHEILGGISVNYYYEENSDHYMTLVIDDDIDFPETISTLETLASWLIQNVPLNENAYIDDVDYPNIPELKWYDFSDQEFEFSNNIVYLIGYVKYDTSILQIGTDPIPEIYAYNFYGSTADIATGFFDSLWAQTIGVSDIKVRNGSIINVKDHVKLANNKYLQAPYLYGQLGSNNTKSDAYINTLTANNANIAGLDLQSLEGVIFVEGSKISLNAVTELSLNAESTIGLFGDSDKKIEITNQGVFLLDLPTSDPHRANQLWNDNGVLKISAGE